MDMDKSVRSRLKFAYLIGSINKSQARDKEFIDVTGIDPANCINWFKPDANWLNKYKIGQIEDLYNHLGIKAIGKISPKKRDLIDAIVAHLDEHSDFNPYMEWEAKQEQQAA